VRNGEPLWGPIDWSDNGGGRTVLAPEVRDELSHFADQLAHGVFAVAPRPNMSFIDMRRVFGNRKGAYFLGTTLLPLCLRFPHLGRHLQPTREPRRKRSEKRMTRLEGRAEVLDQIRALSQPWQRYAHGSGHITPLDPERLMAFSFRRRLDDTINPRFVPTVGTHSATKQHWDDVDNGRVLQVLVSSALWYFRVALPCLRGC